MSVGARLASVPGLSMLVAVGDFGAMGARVIRLALTPPYPWWREAVLEFSLALRRCVVPLVVSMIMFAIGIAVLFVGQIVSSLGTADRLIGGLTIGFMREPAMWVTSMIFAGVAGSAMTADLGARKIREELDALAVLGVDAVRALVVPRVVGMTLVAPVLGLVTYFTAMAVCATLVPLFYPSVSFAAEIDTMRDFLFTVDVIALFVKLPIVGLLVGLISCYKGLSTSGGAEGVGRSVNQAVVLMFLALWLLNGLVNGAYLAIFPSASELR